VEGGRASGQESGEEKRPAIPLCVIRRSEVIDQAEIALRCAVLVTVGDSRLLVSSHQVLEAVTTTFAVDLTSMRVAAVEPEDFIIFLSDEATAKSLQCGIPTS
jgi:hypothetical protein